MIAKTFSGGRTYNGALTTIKYLLDDRVEKGTSKLIRGNIEDTKKLIKIASKNKWSWSSGVLSFAESEVSDTNIKKIMNDFEKTFFCGFDKSEYDISWIKHTDKGRVELHYISPRLELRTGKAYNPYFVSRDFKKKDLFQKCMNAKYGLIAPEDNPQPTKQNRKKWANDRKSLLAQIDTIVAGYMNDGLIETRDDIVYLLRDLGLKIKGLEEKHKYLTVTTENKTKIRLKGAIYGQNYDYTREKSREAEKENSRTIGNENRQDVGELVNRLDEIVRKQAEYNSNRYKSKGRKGNIEDIGNSERKSNQPGEKYNKYSEERNREDKEVFSPYRPSGGLDSRFTNYISDNERLKNDEIREDVARKFRRIGKEFHELKAGVSELEEGVSRFGEDEHREAGKIERIGIEQECKREIINGIEQKMGELDKFKTEINLAEFMTSFGYRLDAAKSSRNSPVLIKDDDKIIISQSKENGHYIYFNANNDDDAGTIVDFIQKRFNEHLGNVRKRIREWIKHPPKNTQKILIAPSSKDVNRIINLWTRLKSENFTEPYRGISTDILNGGNTRIKKVADTVYFMLSNKQGLCGIEQRSISQGSKVIMKGSEKGVWTKNNLKNAKRIIITESPIDAMSYEQLHGQNEDYYVATCGNIGDNAKESLRVILSSNRDAKIFIATDNDNGGIKISNDIVSIIGKIDEYLDRASRTTPKLKDWNDDLIAKISIDERKQSPTPKPKPKPKPKIYPTYSGGMSM